MAVALPGRPRIATRPARAARATWSTWRSSSGAPSIATCAAPRRTGQQATGGGRPPGRPRIGTADRTRAPSRKCQWRSRFKAAEDRNSGVRSCIRRSALWRSPSGVAEDRNAVHRSLTVEEREWRSPSGTTEDRNLVRESGYRDTQQWRSPSGATEDRNAHALAVTVSCSCRGGRPPGRPGIATSPGRSPSSTGRRGGRSPGRPRIATARPASRPAPGGLWRSPNGDRGSQRLLRRGRLADSGAAVTFRGDSGSQRTCRDARSALGSVWRLPFKTTADRNPHEVCCYGAPPGGGRPPGRPRIATSSPGSVRACGRVAAVALRDGRGTQPYSGRARAPPPASVAVALLGGRGSQRPCSTGTNKSAPLVAGGLRATATRHYRPASQQHVAPLGRLGRRPPPCRSPGAPCA